MPVAVAPLTVGAVARTWWPLAASWLLMSAELPLVSAIMARLADPTVHLAAYGGIVFPLSMIVEAPIIMLLSASTALSRDRRSFALLRRFMLWTGAGLTALHLLVALTPLYGFVVGSLIHAPEEIRGPARIGLIIMTPWTFSIAYRRLHQGVLIRFNRSHSVGIGTAIRLSGNIVVLAIGYAIRTLPGIVVGASAVAFGVVSEAIYIGLVSRPIMAKELKETPSSENVLTLNEIPSLLHSARDDSPPDAPQRPDRERGGEPHAPRPRFARGLAGHQRARLRVPEYRNRIQ